MITKDMLISEALKHGNIEAMAEVLQNFGMHCLGCAMARGETIEEAAGVHGIDVDVMIQKLNEVSGL